MPSSVWLLRIEASSVTTTKASIGSGGRPSVQATIAAAMATQAAAYGIRIARRCESSSTTAAKGLRAIHGVAPAITTAAVHDPR